MNFFTYAGNLFVERSESREGGRILLRNTREIFWVAQAENIHLNVHYILIHWIVVRRVEWRKPGYGDVNLVFLVNPYSFKGRVDASGRGRG